MNKTQNWERFQHYFCRIQPLNLALDVSRIKFADDFFAQMEPAIKHAYQAMNELERGAIANPDEGRMVGHYWLRDPQRAPSPELTAQIEEAYARVKSFAADIHAGRIMPLQGSRFRHLLLIGIGGSALGPMFVADALSNPETDRMQVHYIDNTDPDGIARTLAILDGHLNETLCIVTSKSGSTPETRNGMLTVANAYRAIGLHFPSHAVAITMPGSQLDQLAQSEKWIERFPMFDWVGGRTSELSVVGLLPAALQGFDIDALLEGAKLCDEAARSYSTLSNPAMLLALAWHHATGGHGRKDMVVLPYKDRLLLFSRYLQQLVMESLGKRLDLEGNRVDQGISVYGNKGSTDQHAYVQQLRDGIDNFFVIFIRVLETGGDQFEVEPQITSGDYLHGFLLGTRAALFDNNRESIMITIPRVDARTIGALIALFERTVGFYASLIGINAYNQPGVEAGKKAATAVLALQLKILATLSAVPQTAGQIAAAIGSEAEVETVYLILEHLAANGRAQVARLAEPGAMTFHLI